MSPALCTVPHTAVSAPELAHLSGSAAKVSGAGGDRGRESAAVCVAARRNRTPDAVTVAANGKSDHFAFSSISQSHFLLKRSQAVCDWCKHIRHTKEYLDFGAGERRLQFCSAKCLNQYKMDIFYKETQAALPGGLCAPGHPSMEGKSESGGGVQLLTPESWNTPLGDLRRKAPSPGGAGVGGGGGPVPGPSGSSSASPSESSGPGGSSSSSRKIPTPGPRPHESPTLPPPVPTLHPPMGVPPGSPPMVMTPRGPVPLPFFMEHQMMQQIRPPPFLRAPHTPGPNSPLPNPMIPPGIGPPPPPRNLGPPSSPMHRPMLSPHIHPPSTPTIPGNPPPGLMPPHPATHMPGLPFPAVNMMPNGHLPMPPVMNFGVPSLAPLVPPPTLLVPYPVIVPLPVPIPIPVPIPFSPKASGDRHDNGDTIPNTSGEGEGEGEGDGDGGETKDPSGLFSSPGSSGGGAGSGTDNGDSSKQGLSKSNELSPGFSGHPLSRTTASPEQDRTDPAMVVDLTVKAEDPGGKTRLSLSLPLPPAAVAPPLVPPPVQDGVIDLTLGRRTRLQQVIQRATPSVQVKTEPEPQSVLNLAPGGGGASTCGGGVVSTGREEHRDIGVVADGGPQNLQDPVALSLPCGDPAYCSATPPLPAPQPPHTDPTHTSSSSSSSSSAPCNVIVNGTRSPDVPSSWSTPNPTPAPHPEQRLENPTPRRAATAAIAMTTEEPAVSELESVKENNCSGMEMDASAGKKALLLLSSSATVAAAMSMSSLEEGGAGPGGGGGGGDKQDASPADEDHAYALPLLPKAACVIQPVPKPADKTAMGPLGAPHHAGPGTPDLQPPLKRSCDERQHLENGVRRDGPRPAPRPGVTPSPTVDNTSPLRPKLCPPPQSKPRPVLPCPLS
ncbi:hypothetical protein JZ751_003231 [Albula glossodonta]|uniref:Sine oculis-binding protein homolog n=1 Tax=Albula glossodonta TaxID=121402 RepID=A0A8T2N902_9TELE|nr:hypothetical protein JZ751_003231 [Albula glossodonta]